MNCERFQENISACLDKQLDRKEEELLHEHLEKCPECMKLFRAFEKMDILIKKGPKAGFDINTENEIWNRIAEELKLKKKAPSLKIRIFLSAAALFIVCLIVFLFGGNLTKTPEAGISDPDFTADARTQLAANMTLTVLFKDENKTQKDIMEEKYAEIVAEQLFRKEKI